MILARANEPTWPQVIGRERHSFQNPLRQNDAQVPALEAVVLESGSSVELCSPATHVLRKGCRLVSAMPRHWPTRSRHSAKGRCAQLCAAWDRVIAIDRTDRAAHQEHLRGLQTRHGGVRRIWVPVALLAGSVLWLSVSMDIHGTATHRLAGSAAAPTRTTGVLFWWTGIRQGPRQFRQCPSRTRRNRDTLRAVNRPTQSPPERIAMIEWAPPHAG